MYCNLKGITVKVVILAGGFGTRISEESHLKPKPMVEIGEKPILWHIMKSYSHYGYNEFIICGGYKQQLIKEYFANYYLHQSDITFDFTQGNQCVINHSKAEPWKVTIVDTGLNTMTGGRIKRIQKYIGDETFMLTYGDGVSNINYNELYNFHKRHGKIATVTSFNIGQKFGCLEIGSDNTVKAFREKCDDDGSLVNIGFMVLEPSIFEYLIDDTTVFEKAPLENLVKEGELKSFRHNGFWQCMDTLRDKQLLEKLWSDNKAPWKVW